MKMWNQYAPPRCQTKAIDYLIDAYICERLKRLALKRCSHILGILCSIVRLVTVDFCDCKLHTNCMYIVCVVWCVTVDENAMHNATEWAHTSFSSIITVQYFSARCTWNAFFFSSPPLSRSHVIFFFRIHFCSIFRKMFSWSYIHLWYESLATVLCLIAVISYGIKWNYI